MSAPPWLSLAITLVAGPEAHGSVQTSEVSTRTSGVSTHIALTAGDLLANGSLGIATGLFLINETGQHSLLAEGTFTDFAASASGILYATAYDSVVRIDPANGATATLTSGLSDAVGIAVSYSDDIFVAVRGEGPVHETAALLRVQHTGEWSPVSQGGFLGPDDPETPDQYALADIEMGRDGQVLVLDVADQANTAQILSIDPDTGHQTRLPIDPTTEITDPTGLFAAFDGRLLVSQLGLFLGVGDFLIDPETGDSEGILGDMDPKPGDGGGWVTLETGFDQMGTVVRAKSLAAPTGLIRFLGTSDQEWEVIAPGTFDEIQVVPPPLLCGDGQPASAEECDDGNSISGDGCSLGCLLEICGNGRIDPPEACDDSNLASGDGCDVNCTSTACGNSIMTDSEECDDGNEQSGDGCDSNCTTTGCGNGIVTTREECDDADPIDDNGCNRRCRVDFGEQTKRQRRCIRGVNRAVRRLVALGASANEQCVSEAAEGRLGDDPGALELCIGSSTAPDRERVERWIARFEQDHCTRKPPELALSPPLLAGLPHASEASRAFVRDLFGRPATISRQPSRAARACHEEVVRRGNDVMATIWSVYEEASRRKLAGRGTSPAVSDSELREHAAQAIAGSRLVYKASQTLQDELGSACAYVSGLSALFPGCAAEDADRLGECVERVARCRACLLVNEVNPGVGLECESAALPEMTCPPER